MADLSKSPAFVSVHFLEQLDYCVVPKIFYNNTPSKMEYFLTILSSPNTHKIRIEPLNACRMMQVQFLWLQLSGSKFPFAYQIHF